MAKKRRASTVDPNESKSDKFSRLASYRVTKAVKAIASIGQLATRSYEYTPAQVKEIKKYLAEACNAVEARFEGTPEAAGEIKI